MKVTNTPPKPKRWNGRGNVSKNPRSTVFFPADVHAGLQQYATREDRSVTSLIVHLCRRALEAKRFLP